MSIPWVAFNADPRATAIPWLTEEEYKAGLIYVATDLHKQLFFDIAALATKDKDRFSSEKPNDTVKRAKGPDSVNRDTGSTGRPKRRRSST